MMRIIYSCSVFLAATSLLSICQVPQASKDSVIYLYPIVERGEYGYIDSRGQVVISPRFENAYYFSEGLAAVEIEGKWGYIDTTGSFVIQPQYDNASAFSCGLARVSRTSFWRRPGWSFIDHHGELRIDYRGWDLVIGFTEGLANVFSQEHGSGYINVVGNYVIGPSKSLECGFDFSEGLAVVRIGGKYGFIDKMGNIIINPRFRYARDFSEGLAAVQSWVDETFGYIDKTGKFIIDSQFETTTDFKSGIACVKQGGLWGYIDKSGKFLITPQYEWSGNYSEGLAPIVTGGKWGYIDSLGNIAISPQFYSALDFRGELAMVRLDSVKINRWGYIDRFGKIVWQTSE